jgi:hypothetical protein
LPNIHKLIYFKNKMADILLFYLNFDIILAYNKTFILTFALKLFNKDIDIVC